MLHSLSQPALGGSKSQHSLNLLPTIPSRRWPALSKLLTLAGAMLASTLNLSLSSNSGFILPYRAQRRDEFLKTLRPKHPRLLILDEDLTVIRQKTENDTRVRRWYEQLESQAEKMLKESPAEHNLTPNMLGQSRDALRRITTLAGLYRLDGDKRKVARARAEMLAAANFPDWHPAHFLDTAELTTAMAIGYDWLYDYLSPEDRSAIQHAIVDKGLKPGRQAYNDDVWWAKTTSNWNQVCNAGLTLGALAIANDEPTLASEIVGTARYSIVSSMRSFAPDGGDEEGPEYWNYATKYNVFYLAALQTALGTDFNFKDVEGLADTGKFRIHLVGPLELPFNYADAEEKLYPAHQMFWYAHEFRQPSYVTLESTIADRRPEIFHLLWAGNLPAIPEKVNEPLDKMFRSVDVSTFRGAWDDNRAFYIGFKGGNNAAPHAHLDLGSFVLDALGARWALDLGADSYQLPGYFGNQRWSYYRTCTEGHNTLTIDGENQDTTARTRLVAFLSTPRRAFAVVDLTDAYRPKLTSALRGLALLDRQHVLVQDEVQSPEPLSLVWNFHTSANIDLHDNRAVLSQGGVKIQARILSPDGARFEVMSANPVPPQKQQPDVRNLVIRLPERVTNVRISVLIDSVDSEFKPTLEPLIRWIAVGQIRH
jgi:hypothetical protein